MNRRAFCPQVRKNCDRAESVHRFVRTVTEPNLSVCLSLLVHFKSNLTFNKLTIVAMNNCLIVDNQHIVDWCIVPKNSVLARTWKNVKGARMNNDRIRIY